MDNNLFNVTNTKIISYLITYQDLRSWLELISNFPMYQKLNLTEFLTLLKLYYYFITRELGISIKIAKTHFDS